MGVSTSRPLSEDEQDFRNRIIIPVLDADNTTWLGYVGRTLGKSNLTYMYKRGMFRGEILYNQKQVYIQTEEPLLVVEGTLDVAYVWPNAVATLGTWSEAQVQILREARRPVAVVLDGDAWRKGEALSMKLKLYGVRAGFVRLPPTLDPDDVESSWLQTEIQKCLA
jgi:DNA primase